MEVAATATGSAFNTGAAEMVSNFPEADSFLLWAAADPAAARTPLNIFVGVLAAAAFWLFAVAFLDAFFCFAALRAARFRFFGRRGLFVRRTSPTCDGGLAV